MTKLPLAIARLFQAELSGDFLKCLAELRLRGVAGYSICPTDLSPRTTLHTSTEHITSYRITLHYEFVYEDFHFKHGPGIPRRVRKKGPELNRLG
jgi:hypothetical protein